MRRLSVGKWCAGAALCACLLLSGATSSSAQTVINPSTVEFDVSTDHNAIVVIGTDPGVAVVTRYELRIFAPGVTATTAAAATSVFDLGKPTPTTGTKVSVTNVAMFQPLTASGAYNGRVVAIGPGGEGASDPVPFGKVLPAKKPTAVAFKVP